MPGGMTARIQQADLNSRIGVFPSAPRGQRNLNPAAIFLEQRQGKPECCRCAADLAADFPISGRRHGPIERASDLVDEMPVFAEPERSFLDVPVSFCI